ncbi:MAG: class I SAM-dependent methyltransferase [Deltaproteobacteria bacterium]|nr:class I SAM-dependent methyltransferase [Deltaproteobacteria bacterium]
MKGRILDTAWGVALYLLLRNDVSWALLSDEDRRRVKAANLKHNTQRPTYADPTKYGGGRTYDLPGERRATAKGALLQDFLDKGNPESILEVGPGSGYYTRQLVEHPSVKRYAAIDIGGAFIEFLEPRLSQLKNVDSRLYCGDVITIDLDSKFEAIVLLSAVHHIPDRLELFQRLFELLADGGRIFAFDAAHYLPRLWRLSKKMVGKGYLTKAYRADVTNLSTHHMCTLGEYRKICRRIEGLQIEAAHFGEHSRPFNWFLKKNQGLTFNQKTWLRFFSSRMAIIMKKTGQDRLQT